VKKVRRVKKVRKVRKVRRLRHERVAVFLIIVGIVLMSFINVSIAISKVVKLEKFEPTSEEEFIIEDAPSETKLIDTTKNAYDEVEIVFDLSQSINLELSSPDDIYIKMSYKSSSEKVIEKNKIWDKYILDKDGYKIKNGVIQPGTYKIRFTKSELEDVDVDDIYIDFLIRKNGEDMYSIQMNDL